MNRCTKAIIYKSNLEYNIKQIQNFVEPGVKLCIAVKADSYGHNAVLTSEIAEKIGVDYLAVATVSEGGGKKNFAMPELKLTYFF